MSNQTLVNELNGIDLDVLQDTVGEVRKDPGLGKCRFRARNMWESGTHNSTTLSDFYAAREEMSHKHPFELHTDEPPMLAGQDEAPNPVEYLLHALAGCITTSVVAHAAVRGIHIDSLESELEGDIDISGFLGLAPDVPKGFTDIRVRIRANAEPEDLDKLHALVEFSPVLNTITRGAKVNVVIEPV